MSKLFSAVKVGPYTLSHRVAMAPLTRMRSEPGDVPGDLIPDPEEWIPVFDTLLTSTA